MESPKYFQEKVVHTTCLLCGKVQVCSNVEDSHVTVAGVLVYIVFWKMAFTRLARSILRSSGAGIGNYSREGDVFSEGSFMPQCPSPFLANSKAGQNLPYLSSIRTVEYSNLWSRGVTMTPHYQFAQPQRVVEDSDSEYETTRYPTLEATKLGQKAIKAKFLKTEVLVYIVFWKMAFTRLARSILRSSGAGIGNYSREGVVEDSDSEYETTRYPTLEATKLGEKAITAKFLKTGVLVYIVFWKMAFTRLARSILRSSGAGIGNYSREGDVFSEGSFMPQCPSPFLANSKAGQNLPYLSSIRTVEYSNLWSRGVTMTPHYQFAQPQRVVEDSDSEYETTRYPTLEATKLGEKASVVVFGSGWAACGFLKGLDTKIYDVVHMVFTPLLASTCVGTLEFRPVAETALFLREVNHAQEIRKWLLLNLMLSQNPGYLPYDTISYRESRSENSSGAKSFSYLKTETTKLAILFDFISTSLAVMMSVYSTSGAFLSRSLRSGHIYKCTCCYTKSSKDDQAPDSDPRKNISSRIKKISPVSQPKGRLKKDEDSKDIMPEVQPKKPRRGRKSEAAAVEDFVRNSLEKAIASIREQESDIMVGKSDILKERVDDDASGHDDNEIENNDSGKDGSDKSMVVEEEDSNWPLDADMGLGIRASEYFELHPIKNVVGEDGVEIDWEGEIDDCLVNEITCLEWETFAFHPSPLIVLVFERYNRASENWKVLKELEEAAKVYWRTKDRLPPRTIKIDFNIERDLAYALKVKECPQILFLKGNRILYREKEFRSADELVQMIAHFYYNAKKPSCIKDVAKSTY